MRRQNALAGLFAFSVSSESDTTAPRWGTKGRDAMSATEDEQNVNPDAEQDEEAELPANLGDAGKAAIAKERQKAKDAAARAKAAEERAAALEAKQAEADEAKRVADEKAAEEQGKFKELAESRATELAAAKAKGDSAQSKLDALIESIRPDVDAAWKALPEEVAELYTKAVEGDDTHERKAFMASHRKLIDKLTADQNDKNEAFRKVPTTPRPNGNGDPTEAAMDQARRSGKYKV